MKKLLLSAILFFPLLLFGQSEQAEETAHLLVRYSFARVEIKFMTATERKVEYYVDKDWVENDNGSIFRRSRRDVYDNWNKVQIQGLPDLRHGLRYLERLKAQGWEVTATNMETNVLLSGGGGETDIRSSEVIYYDYALSRPTGKSEIAYQPPLEPTALRSVTMSDELGQTFRYSVLEREDNLAGQRKLLRTLNIEKELNGQWIEWDESPAAVANYTPGVDKIDPFADLRLENNQLVLVHSFLGEERTDYQYYFGYNPRGEELLLERVEIQRELIFEGCPRTEQLQILPRRSLVKGEVTYANCDNPRLSNSRKKVNQISGGYHKIAVGNFSFGVREIKLERGELVIMY